jgi:5'-3' exonuclease
MNNITIIDASAVFHSIIHGVFKDKSDWTMSESGKKYLDEDKLRSGIIGSFLYYKNIKHFADECIIAIDKPPYWRKDILPFYKGARKKNKEESDIDWTAQFVVIDKVMNEIKKLKRKNVKSLSWNNSNIKSQAYSLS